MAEEHKINVITTKLMGTWHQAECTTCGWLAPRSRSSKAEAQRDGDAHVAEQQR